MIPLTSVAASALARLRTRAESFGAVEPSHYVYSTLLSECGNDAKVVQELMRHAKLSTTMEIYTHPRMERKRETQSQVVDVLFQRKRLENVA